MRKISIYLVKLLVLVVMLFGVYQLINIFDKVVKPEKEQDIAFTGASVSGNVDHPKEDAKAAFERHLKEKKTWKAGDAVKAAKLNANPTASQADWAYNHSETNFTDAEAIAHRSGNKSSEVRVGLNNPSKVAAAKGTTVAAAVPSNSPSKGAQKVSGTPGEPLVTGSLPIGDGLVILMLLCVGYTVRVFYFKYS